MKKLIIELLLLQSFSAFSFSPENTLREIEIDKNYGMKSDFTKICTDNLGDEYIFKKATIVPIQGGVFDIDSDGSISSDFESIYMVSDKIYCEQKNQVENACPDEVANHEGDTFVCPRFKGRDIKATHNADSDASMQSRGALANAICKSFGFDKYKHHPSLGVPREVEARAMYIAKLQGSKAYELDYKWDESTPAFTAKLVDNIYYAFSRFKCE